MAHMGPPPSPKEPRRSGRRSVPSASSSKSPAPSPLSESAPRPKIDNRRTPSSSSSRSKRSKQEDVDDNLDEQLKVIPNTSNGRNKRKNKDKDKQSVPLDPSLEHRNPPKSHLISTETSVVVEQEEEELGGITRCVCGNAENEEAGEFMVQCETCKVWQHNLCVGLTEQSVPEDYYCEQCKPELHQELLKKLAKRTRHASANSHHSSIHAASNSRSSRSRSPVLSSKPQKRRSTMNSRDAAYDESVVKALIEATAAEAASVGTGPSHTPVNGRDAEAEEDGDSGLGNRRKRKRTDDDSISAKRMRSGSVASDRLVLSNLGRDDAASASGSKATPTPTVVTKMRQKRGGGRKAVHVAESVASAEVDEAPLPKRPSRGKGGQHDGRRSHANGPKVEAVSANHPRAHHNSHAYAISQQPLYTSWNLPDYLAHLEPMLPTEVPRPLEIRASGKDLSDISIERGVRVKWPSKRTSIGDMNKRVRSLVEWVGREQAGAMERGRRRDALTKALGEWKRKQKSESSGHVDGMVMDGNSPAESPLQEKPSLTAGLELEYNWLQSPTMKMMEEMMEELINFQERFGPGAKNKDRERRVVST